MNSAIEARRAPLAAAASCAVMLAGACFIAYVMAQAPVAGRAGSPAAPEVRISLAPSPPAATPPATPETATPETVAAATGGSPTDIATGAPAAPSLAAPVDERTADEAVEAELLPRLKPAASPAALATAQRAAMQAPPVLALGQTFLASKADAPPPVFFASDMLRSETAKPPLAVAYAGDMTDGPRALRVTLTRGETFVDAMRRAGVRAEDRNAAAYAFGKAQNLRALRPGQEFVLTVADENKTLFQLAEKKAAPETYLLALDFNADAENRVRVTRSPEGGFEAHKASVDLTSRLVAVSGRIEGSLYLSAKRAGAPDAVIAGLADAFAYDIDFQREILGGDEFEAIFEVRYDEKGRAVDAGDILFGRLTWRGRTKEKGYYRFTAAEDARADFYDRSGESARRLLMKTPIDGARLSSGFGARKHPIYGYTRAHKGVDFAASRGTPIKAAGSGVIVRANRFGSFGNYVRIRHASGYETAYAHLNGFARGIKAGARVSQGDIIGYVGTTGASTGPHLHYEVHLNGVAVNPQSLKIATGISLKGGDLKAFKAQRDMIDAMRLPAAPAPGLLAQDGGGAAL
ncbi:MAG: peptidoglycan DD-metalloendopeptidase family protein [Amphiplicatus sp.]